jgi:hypothetical protein
MADVYRTSAWWLGSSAHICIKCLAFFAHFLQHHKKLDAEAKREAVLQA